MAKGIPRNAEKLWQERMLLLLGTISDLQEKTHSVSLRELAQGTGMCRQTIANWLEVAEQAGYVDRHSGTARGTQLLPRGQRTLDKLTRQAIATKRQPKKASEQAIAV